MSEKGKICETCKKSLEICPGHFGYMKLELPVFHVGYFKHVVNILQSICKDCCHLLMSDTDRAKYLQQYKMKSDQ